MRYPIRIQKCYEKKVDEGFARVRLLPVVSHSASGAINKSWFRAKFTTQLHPFRISKWIQCHVLLFSVIQSPLQSKQNTPSHLMSPFCSVLTTEFVSTYLFLRPRFKYRSSKLHPGACLPTKIFWVGGGLINLEELWMTQNSWKIYFIFFNTLKNPFSEFVQLQSPSEIIGTTAKNAAFYLTPQVMNNQFKRPSPWGLKTYLLYL